mmetsp:Transcript_1749/g.3079  ORF Transcript_1749/g.3079 Transcript_1749/m.3079 type:complete len:157 (-) Transcript_1749:732-1202(-)
MAKAVFKQLGLSQKTFSDLLEYTQAGSLEALCEFYRSQVRASKDGLLFDRVDLKFLRDNYNISKAQVTSLSLFLAALAAEVDLLPPHVLQLTRADSEMLAVEIDWIERPRKLTGSQFAAILACVNTHQWQVQQLTISNCSLSPQANASLAALLTGK